MVKNKYNIIKKIGKSMPCPRGFDGDGSNDSCRPADHVQLARAWCNSPEINAGFKLAGQRQHLLDVAATDYAVDDALGVPDLTLVLQADF